MAFTIQVPTEEMLARYARSTSWSFAFPEAQALDTAIRRGLADHRVVLDGDRFLGGAYLHHMAQHLGGQRIRCLGIGGVAVDPEVRGRGAAGALMRAILRGARAEGYPLSALYPATQPMYRKLGYEQAGRYTRVRVPLSSIDARPGPCRIEEVAAVDRMETLKALYFSAARRSHGHFERSTDIWSRIVEPLGPHPRVFLLYEQEAPAGYLVLSERRTEGFEMELDVRDMVVTSRASLKTALGFFVGHGSLARAVVLPAPALDAVPLGLVEQRWQVTEDWRFLLRVVDVKSALEALTYPQQLEETLHLDVTDDVLPENAGRWQLRLSGGAAEVVPGGQGTIRLDVRALAPLIGHLAHPADVAMADLLKAPSPALEKLGAAFSGPPASSRDFF